VSQVGRELPEEEREPFWLPAGPVRVLEVGCGTADDVGTLLASGRVAEYIGVDLDELAVVRARAQWPRATFLCADAAQLPEAYHRRFDLVLIRRPDMLAQPSRWRQVFAKVSAYLGDGGRVVVITLGQAEAAVARQWLEEAGMEVAQGDVPDGPMRWVLVAAPARRPHVWEDAEAAPSCDVGFGGCCSPGKGAPWDDA